MRHLCAALLALFIGVGAAYADATVDQLTPATTLTGPELVPIFQGGNPLKNTTASAISTFVRSQVTQISGITVSGTPSAGQILVATSAAAAAWNGTLNVTPGGPVTITPTLNTFTPGLVVTYSAVTGSGTGGALNSITITDAYGADSGGVSGFFVNHVVGGPTVTGGRNAIVGFMTLGAPTSPSNPDGQRTYSAAAFEAIALTGDNGTNTGAGAKGAIFAISALAIAKTGATNLLGLTGMEIGPAAQTGSTMSLKFGINIVPDSTDAVHAATAEAALGLSSIAGAVGLNNGILFHSNNGQAPLISTGTMFATQGSATVGSFLDFSSYTCTGKEINFTGLSVDCTGAITTPSVVATSFLFGPIVIGGNAPGSALELRSTSGVGTTDYIKLTVGNAGATEAMRILHSGGIGIGTTTDPGVGSLYVNVKLGVGVAPTHEVDLAAGTTSIAPIRIAAGTNLTTAAAGAIEYDGKAFYSTANASNRGVAPSENLVVLANDYTMSDVNTAQKAFNASTNGALTLPGSVTYEFEAVYLITNTGTTSHTWGVTFGGNATFTSGAFRANAYTATGNTLTADSTIYATSMTATTVVTAASTSATENVTIVLKGQFRINGAGTLIPQVVLSAATTGTEKMLANSYFRCWPVGSNTVATVGNWSFLLERDLSHDNDNRPAWATQLAG